MASVIITVVLKTLLIGYFAIFIMARLKSGHDELRDEQDLP